jgi:hypothetical protein
MRGQVDHVPGREQVPLLEHHGQFLPGQMGEHEDLGAGRLDHDDAAGKPLVPNEGPVGRLEPAAGHLHGGYGCVADREEHDRPYCPAQARARRRGSAGGNTGRSGK